jgi:ATP-dependent DNA helicase PIF1
VEALDIMNRGRGWLSFGGRLLCSLEISGRSSLLSEGGRGHQIVDASLWRSYLLDSMRHVKLAHNMRAQSDPWFADYLLCIDGSIEEDNGDGDVHLLDKIRGPHTLDDSDLDRLIESIFLRLSENLSNTNYVTSRAILSTRNDWVDEINMKMNR